MQHNVETNKVSPLQRRHYVLMVLTVIVAIILVLVGIQIRDNEPDYYTPGRTHLVNAKQKLAEFLYHEKLLIIERRLAHEELDKAVHSLASAENLDPLDKKAIDELRSKLDEIISSDKEGNMSQDRLQAMYAELLRKIDVLIKHTESPR